ncbi:penicillin-binding protein activator [Pseudooceanicola aestuarii]|uniref:penicillin-binding protein activator n=1 Tax=Pseudooceanicola aestuarii TaxID=2697319 RepID=UPI0013D40262|nr:penicillin-binding protein activator [Pseudooceanicola aestuarii]
MFALLRAARKVLSRPLRRAAATGGLLTLAACGDVGLGTGNLAGGGPSVNVNQPVQVALLVPQGSEKEGDRTLAASLENAARLAAADLNGVQLDLRVYDTAGNAQTAATAAKTAVEDGAKIILGPVYADNAAAVGQVAAQADVNVLAFSNNSSVAGGNVFILGPTFENTARRLTAHAVANGKGRIVTVHADNASGAQGAAAIRAAAATSGAQIMQEVQYEFSQNGVVQAIPQVRDAVRGNDADAVFLTSNTAGALPFFSQLLPEGGVRPEEVQYIGLTRWDMPPQTMELPGVQGGWFALPDPGRTAAFNARYLASQGADPHPIAGLAYDGVAAIGALVQGQGRTALTRGAITQGAGFQGVNGVFRFLPDGTAERALAVATIRDQKLEILSPAPAGFGGAGS